VQIERSASQRLAGSQGGPPRALPKPQQQIDLFGDDPTPAPPRPSTGPPGSRPVPLKSEPAPPKQTKAGDSLLGLDFMGGGGSQPSRPSSTGPQQSAGAPSRPDLKQSILSLYASAPKQPLQQQAQQHARQDSFGGLSQPQQSPQQSQFGGMNDAFSSLSFSAQPAQPQVKPSPFAGLDNFSSTRSPPAQSSSNMFGGGGSFFDTTKSTPATQTYAQKPATSGFGDFSSFTSPAASKPAPQASGMNDLLDLSMPSAAPSQHVSSPQMSSPPMNNAFNLSQPAPSAPAPKAAPVAAPSYSGFSSMDAWGSSDNAWASPAPSQPAAPAVTSSHAPPPSSGGWGAPQVAQDDDFGGWSSAAPTATTTTHTQNTTQSKPSGGFGGGGDDLFSNVWE
jgi:stromal membrane-associated protein